MITYKDYEKEVYDWLMQKHEIDSSFMFSLRQKATKGTELDYFIGTEKSNYFGITFWTLPISYPGSSTDCINLIFGSKGEHYGYKFEFTQTNSPQDAQNQSALNLIKNVEIPIKEKVLLQREGSQDKKMFAYVTKQRSESYTDLASMLLDIEKDLDSIIPIINNSIEEEKIVNPEFIAHRISSEEFENMQSKLKKRFEKHIGLNKNINYWVFQANPDIYNITKALKAAFLKSWKVASHRDKIKIGDKVIIWQTGKNAGCYALAEVTSEVSVFKEEPHEQGYNSNQSDVSTSERVKIKIEHYLAESPILWEEIKNIEIFSDFKAGNQGTNFSATKEEYNELKNLIDSGNTFQKTRAKIDSKVFNEYIDFVRQLIKSLNIKPNDPRVVYSVRGYKLNFIVGQKYCVNVYSSKYKENFGVISTKKISNNSEQFAGSSPETFYNYMNELHLDKAEKKTVIDAIESVLEKTKKSGYSKSNDTDFEKYVFGSKFKNKINMRSPINQILYGPPGTGKTYATISKAVAIANPKFNLEQERSIIKEEYKRLVGLNQIVFTTFHQSMSYEEFVEGIKPQTKDGLVTYEIEDGIFKKICNDAELYSADRVASVSKKVDLDKRIKNLRDELEQSEDSEVEIAMTKTSYHITSITEKHIKFRKASGGTGHDLVIDTLKGIALGERDIIGGLRSYYDYLIQYLNTYSIAEENVEENKPYVLIIDEINRGNVSQIFGELITLIENDKRLGEDEALVVQLPYSKTKFGVPPNLFIIGTMNTADRSIEALDTALRRRFIFEETPPKPSLLKTAGESGKSDGIITLVDGTKIDLETLLLTINNRIEKLIDKDHKIGHSYFLKVNSEASLKKAFKNKVIPLLEEYFFGDFGKIGLVLGNSFIDRKDESFSFSAFKHYDDDIVEDLKSKAIFKINNDNLWNFKAI